MKKLIEWLKTPLHSYADGVSILKELRPKDAKFYESVSNPARDSYHFRKLEKDLANEARKLAQHPHPTASQDKPVKPNIQVVDLTKNIQPTRGKGRNTEGKNVEKAEGKKTETMRIVGNPLIDVKELPEYLQQKYFRTKAITTAIARNHAQMKEVKANEKRKQLVNENVELETEKDNIWAELDTWWKENKKTDAKPDSEEDKIKKAAKEAVDKSKRIRTLKIQIGRAEKELPGLSGKKLDTRNVSLKGWKKELAKLEKEL